VTNFKGRKFSFLIPKEGKKIEKYIYVMIDGNWNKMSHVYTKHTCDRRPPADMPSAPEEAYPVIVRPILDQFGDPVHTISNTVDRPGK
jgi:hypothetical protein